MRIVKILLLLLLFTGIAQTASAKGAIVYHTGPKGSTLEMLPADAVIDGQHVNFGVVYDQFGLFWLPLWNYGETEYALISDDENTFWSLDEETLEMVKSEYELDIPDTPSIPFWQKVGLKPVVILLFLFFILGKIRGK